MIETVNVRLLADVPQVIPTLAEWYKQEWPAWFADMPLAQIEADFQRVANRDCLPFAVVALDHETKPIGVCSIRDEDFAPYPDAGPWLKGLYVVPAQRSLGIAGELIRAAAKHAGSLGVIKAYAATHAAIGTFEHAGWLGFDQVRHEQQMLTVFAKRLA